MLNSIKAFFEQHMAPAEDERGAMDDHRLRLAVAALLIEIIRMDDHIAVEERTQILASLADKFGLDVVEAEELIRLAEEETRQATDVYQFTSQINRHFSPQQKIAVIEHMWRAAYADGALNKYEEHLVRKVAELIYVPHTAFIAAKHRVLNQQAVD